MNAVYIAPIFFVCAVAIQRVWIDLMRRSDMGETIKWYGPKAHRKKGGTPSIGGIAAIVMVPFVMIFQYLACGASVMDLAEIWIYPLLAALIGAIDDFLKKFHHSSEGLTSLQKLALQLIFTIPCAYYVSTRMLGGGIVWMAILTFIGVGLMNAVNVTDGLDGLAAGAVSISLAAFAATASNSSAISASILGLALSLAFLWHNTHPAELFMGDAGAHLWAGLILSLCLKDGRLWMVFPLGSLFGIEIFTVAVQIAAIRKFHRKVFLMSPLHHHFELKGWAETKIVGRFLLTHLIGFAVLFAIFSEIGKRYL